MTFEQRLRELFAAEQEDAIMPNRRAVVNRFLRNAAPAILALVELVRQYPCTHELEQALAALDELEKP